MSRSKSRTKILMNVRPHRRLTLTLTLAAAHDYSFVPTSRNRPECVPIILYWNSYEYRSVLIPCSNRNNPFDFLVITYLSLSDSHENCAKFDADIPTIVLSATDCVVMCVASQCSWLVHRRIATSHRSTTGPPRHTASTDDIAADQRDIL